MSAGRKGRGRAEEEGPFASLGGLRDRLRAEGEREKDAAASIAEPAGPEPAELDEDELFLLAASGAAPLGGKPVRGPGDAGPPPLPKPPVDEDSAVLEELGLLVRGEIHFELANRTEVIEGAVCDLDRRILRRLRRGEFSVQANLDLHRLFVAEAREMTRGFILDSVRAGLRCVRIVHGKGLHSKSDGPVLKDHAKRWLSQGLVGRCVLAFTSAQPRDGGTGAIYVLLRRRPAQGDRRKPLLTRE